MNLERGRRRFHSWRHLPATRAAITPGQDSREKLRAGPVQDVRPLSVSCRRWGFFVNVASVGEICGLPAFGDPQSNNRASSRNFVCHRYFETPCRKRRLILFLPIHRSPGSHRWGNVKRSEKEDAIREAGDRVH